VSHDDLAYQIQNLEDEVRHVKQRLENDLADERRDREDGERSLHVRIDDADKEASAVRYRLTAIEERLDTLEYDIATLALRCGLTEGRAREEATQ